MLPAQNQGLYDLLRMDFNSNLAKIQGLLIKFNGIFPFAKMRIRSDIEIARKQIIQGFTFFLEEKEYMTKGAINKKHSKELREITFFLILNSNLQSLDFIGEGGLDHVIRITPTIPICLFVSIIEGLNLNDFIAEAISYCYPKLSMNLIDAVISNLRHTQLEHLPKRIEQIAGGIYNQIVLLNFIEDENINIDESISFMSEKLIEILNFFINPPDAESMNTWKNNRLYKYGGLIMLHLINLILRCLNTFMTALVFGKEEHNIYLLSHTRKPFDKPFVEYKENVSEHLYKCNTLLLDTCKTNLRSVNLDMYCCWSEFDYNENLSWQEAIGDKAFELKVILQKIPSLKEHDLMEMLTQIAREPKNLTDVIESADRNTLLENVCIKGDDQEEWMKALVAKDFLLTDLGCMTCVADNINACNEADSIVLFEKILDALCKSNDLYDEDKKSLALSLLRNVNLESQEAFIHKVFDGQFDNILQTADFTISLTELFNRIPNSEDIDMTQVNAVFVQNPMVFFEICIENAIKSQRQVNVTLSILEKLSKFNNSNICTEDLILSSVQKVIRMEFDLDKEQHNLYLLLTGLYSKKLTKTNEFLLKVLMPTATDIRNRNFPILTVQLKSLLNVFDVSEHSSLIAPTLAMLAQVMESVRWNLITFTGDAVHTMNEAVALQQHLFEFFIVRSLETDKEYKWLKLKVQSMKPLNRYYFRHLWPADATKNLYLWLFDQNKSDVKSLTVKLCQILPQSTSNEWKAIYESLNLKSKDKVEVMLSTLLTISLAINEVDRRTANICLLYCCRNGVMCLKDTISTFSVPIDAIGTFAKILRLIGAFMEDMQKDTLSIFLPVITQIIAICKKIDRDNGATVNIDNLKKIIESETNDVIRDLVEKLFTEE